MIREYLSVRAELVEDIILQLPVEYSEPNIILNSPTLLVFVSLIGTIDQLDIAFRILLNWQIYLQNNF